MRVVIIESSPKLSAPRKQELLETERYQQARKGTPGSARSPKHDPTFRNNDRRHQSLLSLQGFFRFSIRFVIFSLLNLQKTPVTYARTDVHSTLS